MQPYTISELYIYVKKTWYLPNVWCIMYMSTLRESVSYQYFNVMSNFGHRKFVYILADTILVTDAHVRLYLYHGTIRKAGQIKSLLHIKQYFVGPTGTSWGRYICTL